MKRILACLFIVAVLPSLTSQMKHQRAGAIPFGTTAVAGHTLSTGGRAECACEIGPDGVCPCCGLNINFIQAQDNVDNPVIQPAPSAPENQPDSNYYDSGALLLLLALVAWNRIPN